MNGLLRLVNLPYKKFQYVIKREILEIDENGMSGLAFEREESRCKFTLYRFS